MFRLMAIWLIFTVFIILNTFGIGPVQESMAVLYIGWAAMLVGIIFLFVQRRYMQNKYKKMMNEQQNTILDLERGEYFYQAPLVTVDDQPIKVHGKEDMHYKLSFNNSLQKWMSIGDVLSLNGMKLTSNDHEVEILPSKMFTIRHKFKVFLDGNYIGRYELKKLFKDKGIKEYLPLFFETENKNYDFTNKYAELTSSIQDSEEDTVLTANRSFFDLSSDKRTSRRGEKHDIHIKDEKEFPEEVWLGLYIQAMNVKNEK
ncbi:hypothetical protein ACFOU0_02960 [Salinicoccus sesuvii]|uniref:Uncharacterized protein n=1 Tax=Salinicoccus sesuvii TaxID=868281 RepID=A0ABV7N2S9_9STAP